jgi:CobQ-like glutamine amidotransferase family enzyme
MPRPKVDKRQRTIDDLVLEDAELEDALQTVTDNESAAKAYREARQIVKTRMQTEHADAINQVLDNGRGRWNVCGGHRFLYQTARRPAGTKPAPAGTTTRLDIHRLADD